MSNLYFFAQKIKNNIRYTKRKKEKKHMNIILLIFFAIPIAVIIFSIALQRILKSPVLVAAIFFAIFLVVTFIISNINFLVATIIYTILAFITALLTKIICKILRRLSCESESTERNCCRERNRTSLVNSSRNINCVSECDNCSTGLLTLNGCCTNSNSGDVFTINNDSSNETDVGLLSASESSSNNETVAINSNTGCDCQCTTTNVVNPNTITLSANINPNQNNNGRNGSFSGYYRRRG